MKVIIDDPCWNYLDHELFSQLIIQKKTRKKM